MLQDESVERWQQLSDCQQQLSSLQERHSRQTLELEAQLREQAAVAQQDKLDQVAAVRTQLERWVTFSSDDSSLQCTTCAGGSGDGMVWVRHKLSMVAKYCSSWSNSDLICRTARICAGPVPALPCHTPQVHACAATLPCALCAPRELEDAAKRHSQQQELLSSRIAELDAEGRKLRDQKYQLDTQVSIAVKVIHVVRTAYMFRTQCGLQ